jgi:hypothetical protein
MTIWKLESDSIILEWKPSISSSYPMAGLGTITGNVKTIGASIPGVSVGIDNDTTITTDDNGNFNIKLPYHLQNFFMSFIFQKVFHLL